MLEDNLKKYPPPPPPPPEKCKCLKTILKEFGLLMLFIFLLPFFYLYRFGDRTIVNDCGFGIYILSFIWFFICYDLYIVAANIILIICGLFYWPLLRKLRDLLMDIF